MDCGQKALFQYMEFELNQCISFKLLLHLEAYVFCWPELLYGWPFVQAEDLWWLKAAQFICNLRLQLN